MKKVLLLTIVSCMFLFTACTKNYKTVAEYETAMKTVASKQTDYTIEAKQTVGTVELYYKSYITKDKWKVELSMNGGSSYLSTILYDGNDLMTYSAGSSYAMINPMMDSIDMDDAEMAKSVVNSQNPVYQLINWSGTSAFMAEPEDISRAEFVNNKDNKNGFDCRLIKFGEDREACVSDEYGIAVYHKLVTNDLKHPSNTMTTELNLVKIDKSPISDSVFDLPTGVKKTSMDDMFKNMDRMLDSMKSNYSSYN